MTSGKLQVIFKFVNSIRAGALFLLGHARVREGSVLAGKDVAERGAVGAISCCSEFVSSILTYSWCVYIIKKNRKADRVHERKVMETFCLPATVRSICTG